MNNTIDHTGEALKDSGNNEKMKKTYILLTDENLRFEPGKDEDLLKKVDNPIRKKHNGVMQIIKNDQPASA